MKHISEDNIPEELYNMPVAIYGGGYTGKLIISLLISRGVQLDFIIDDNEQLQGNDINSIKVISYKEFIEYSKRYERVAVILATIYGKTVLNKLDILPNISVYELYDWYMGVNGDKDEILRYADKNEKIATMKKQLGELQDKWSDEESKRVLEGIIQYIDTQDLAIIADICTEEEQYLISEVKKVINGSLTIIDAGAYRGEFLQVLKNNKLSFIKWYCFEADTQNFKFLLKQSENNKLKSGQQICVNKGLYSESGKVFFKNDMGTASKIVTYETDSVIDVVSIDKYMGNNGCNYIKMDIEGAELMALRGGIRLIKRERPILAISIYHSLDDFWQIPLYLMQELNNYKYYVRHHSLIFSETVLYGIPCEL